MTLSGRRLARFGAVLMMVIVGLTWSPLVSSPVLASPPALQACTANNVKVTAQQLGEVRGQRLEAFKLKNTGLTECGMYGYPDLTFFTASRLDARVKVVHRTSAYASVVSFGLSYRGATPTTVAPSKDCLVESILIQLPLAPISSRDFAYHESFNACRAGNVVGVTPVEGRALPQRRVT